MTATALEPKTIQFPKAHSCVILSKAKDANGIERTKLYIQCIDAYRYQRELCIEFRHRPGNLSDLFWECHAYKHPGQRNIVELSGGVALRLIERIMHLAENYPTLLFNDDSERGPRCEGFVHFHDRLLSGEFPNCKMI